MLKLESIPDELTHLKEAVVSHIHNQTAPPPPWLSEDEWKNGFRHFALSHNIDIDDMSYEAMVLLDHRLAHWRG